jgi:hypothetical protein
MTQELIDAAVDLVGLLARENEALGRMDFGRAAAMVGAKRRAAEAFAAASGGEGKGAEITARLAPPLQRQLATLAEENRRLLERAIRVQGKVIGTIAGALARAGEPAGYRADGARAARGSAPALTFSARA